MMTRATTLVFTVLAAIAAQALVSTEPVEADERRVVLVELFTSQGCSSCPPADELLTELGTDGIAGVEVIPLSFHVDYWNYIGWTDPFSAAEWSWRQRRYAARFESDRVYTPQLVVDGVGECVGSRKSDVRREIVAAAERAREALVEVGVNTAGELAWSASLAADAAGSGEVLLAIVETGLSTEVGRGENARRTLRNDHVVRRLETLATLAPGEDANAAHALDLPAEWRRDRLRAVVFVQGVETLEVHGAASAALTSGLTPEG